MFLLGRGRVGFSVTPVRHPTFLFFIRAPTSRLTVVPRLTSVPRAERVFHLTFGQIDFTAKGILYSFSGLLDLIRCLGELLPQLVHGIRGGVFIDAQCAGICLARGESVSLNFNFNLFARTRTSFNNPIGTFPFSLRKSFHLQHSAEPITA